MKSKTNQIESRLAQLEEEVLELKAQLRREGAVPWWQQIVGDIGDKKTFAQMVRLGRQVRKGKIKE